MKQRILSALVALISLFALNTRLTWAQQTPPTAENSAETTEAETGEDREPLVLKAGEKVSSLIVRNRPLVIEGEVAHDVVAFNSVVHVKPGAKVGGHVIVFGGSVKNEAGDKIRPVVSDGTGLETRGETRVSLSDADNSGTIIHAETRVVPAGVVHQTQIRQEAARPNNWTGNQFALLLVGLLGALVLLLVAPRAAEQATDALSFEPGRCLVVGGLGALGLLIVSLFNVMVFKSPVGLFWSPIGTLIGIISVVGLAFGWLCGMRFAGDVLARKFGRHNEGTLFGRIALGLIAFCVVKVVLHGLSGPLGGATLLLEAGTAVMGLGALMISGFGTNPDWLGSRMRGEHRWFSRR